MPTDLENSLPTIPGCITHLEYLIFSTLAYEEEATYSALPRMPERWTFIKDSKRIAEQCTHPLRRAFHAVAYYSDVLKVVLIAIRGTVNLGNIVDDGYVFLGTYPSSFVVCSRFYKDILDTIRGTPRQNYTISVTGHSLGALLAEMLAYTKGLSAVTFESPGSRSAIESYPNTMPLDYTKKIRIYSYVYHQNWINTCTAHIGRIIHIPPDDDIFPVLQQDLHLANTLGAGVFGGAWPIFCMAAAAYLTHTAYNNLMGRHSLANFRALLREKEVKRYMMPTWPPPKTWGEYWEERVHGTKKYLEGKEPLKLFGVFKQIFFTDSNFYINKQWSIDEIINLLANNFTFKTLLAAHHPEKHRTFIKIAPKFQCTDEEMVCRTEDISILEIEQALISIFADLPVDFVDLYRQTRVEKKLRRRHDNKYFFSCTVFGAKIRSRDEPICTHITLILLEDNQEVHATTISQTMLGSKDYDECKNFVRKLLYIRGWQGNFSLRPAEGALQFTAELYSNEQLDAEIKLTRAHMAVNEFPLLSAAINNFTPLRRVINIAVDPPMPPARRNPPPVAQRIRRINYRNQPRITAWNDRNDKNWGILDIKALPDGRFVTVSSDVRLWDPHGVQIPQLIKIWPLAMLPVSRWSTSFLLVGNYLIVQIGNIVENCVINLNTLVMKTLPENKDVKGRAVGYKDRYLICPDHLPTNPHLEQLVVWDLQTTEIIWSQPVKSGYYSIPGIFLLNNDYLYVYTSHPHVLYGGHRTGMSVKGTTIWKINHLNGRGIQSFELKKTLEPTDFQAPVIFGKNSCFFLASGLDSRDIVADVQDNPPNIKFIVVANGGSDQLQVIDTVPSNRVPLTKIYFPDGSRHSRYIYDFDIHHFLTSTREVILNKPHPSSFYVMHLWDKITFTIKQTYARNQITKHGGTYGAPGTPPQMIKLTDECFMTSEQDGIIIWETNSGNKVNHFRLDSTYDPLGTKIAKLIDGRIVIGSTDPNPSTGNNVYLYNFTGI